eukprot:CAMPEP_0172855096 /NCGR_PEP_ID=MMETSP1075-20121228/60082_1 /TAXON_ID=2916 /ORGANISM="Ceratium fusus, Strain PA161109" /LENGTH=37 /DNA_ID= /DNA_START= /DNA_END= /DNA_ORIENTATION=
MEEVAELQPPMMPKTTGTRRFFVVAQSFRLPFDTKTA